MTRKRSYKGTHLPGGGIEKAVTTIIHCLFTHAKFGVSDNSFNKYLLHHEQDPGMEQRAGLIVEEKQLKAIAMTVHVL